jgi:thioesterase domain-containing protein
LRHGDWQERTQYLKYYWDLIPVILQERKKIHRQKSETRERQAALPEEIKLVEQTNVQASRRYHPRPFPGRVVLLRAKEQPANIVEDITLGWEKAQVGEFLIHGVEGQHGNLLMPPYVNGVVEILKQYL